MSCGTFNQVGTTSHNLVSTGVGYVGNTTHTVGTTVVRGVTVLNGQRASYQDTMTFRRTGVVYRDGYSYTIHQGKYVLVR